MLETLLKIQLGHRNTNDIPIYTENWITAVARLKCGIDLDVGWIISDAGPGTDDALNETFCTDRQVFCVQF